MNTRSFILATTVVLAACGGEPQPAADSGAPTALLDTTALAMKVGETGGMKTPESVRYDADLDVFFVSNIDGNPSQADGKGFIAVLRADSTSSMTMLVEGGVNGATLNAPKGIAIIGDTLWVADINTLRAFNKRTGATVATVSLASNKATFLNDVAAGPDGAIYVTDTGIAFDSAGAISHPGVNRVFRIAGRTVSEVLAGDSLPNPNGLTWDARNARWLFAPFAGNDVQSFTPGSTAPVKVASGPGQYDGIEVLDDGMVVVSSWADNALHYFRPGDTTMRVLVANVAAPADMGFDSRRRIIGLPRFNDGKVEWFRMK